MLIERQVCTENTIKVDVLDENEVVIETFVSDISNYDDFWKKVDKFKTEFIKE